jgi:hypothetical protein
MAIDTVVSINEIKYKRVRYIGHSFCVNCEIPADSIGKRLCPSRNSKLICEENHKNFIFTRLTISESLQQIK